CSRGSCVSVPGGHTAPGATMDAGPGPGMAFPPVRRAAPAVAKISSAQSGISVSGGMPTGWVSLSDGGKAAGTRGSLRLNILYSIQDRRQERIHEDCSDHA